MTDKIKDGGAAFPLVAGEDWQGVNPGMSLRDWFAGQALAGIMADPQAEGRLYLELANNAYLAADAMLKVRGDK